MIKIRCIVHPSRISKYPHLQKFCSYFDIGIHRERPTLHPSHPDENSEATKRDRILVHVFVPPSIDRIFEFQIQDLPNAMICIWNVLSISTLWLPQYMFDHIWTVRQKNIALEVERRNSSGNHTPLTSIAQMRLWCSQIVYSLHGDETSDDNSDGTSQSSQSYPFNELEDRCLFYWIHRKYTHQCAQLYLTDKTKDILSNHSNSKEITLWAQKNNIKVNGSDGNDGKPVY